MRQASTLVAWLLALLLVAGTFIAGNSQAQDKAGSLDGVISRA